jgi:hypothetical protein
MGGCFSYDKAQNTLRSSIIGTLIPSDNDFEEFFHLCKTDGHAISSLLHINQNQAFYVVTSGELVVTLTGYDDKAKIMNVFQPGEVINFFRCGTILAGSILSHDIKLTLSFRSSADGGRGMVLGCDYESIDYFLEKHPHLTQLHSFFNLNWADLKRLPCFESLSIQQVRILFKLLFCHLIFFPCYFCFPVVSMLFCTFLCFS